MPTPAEVLRVAAELGPYFTVDTEHGADWLPLERLIADRALLVAEVDRTRHGLATQAGCEPDQIADRTAASIFSVGLFSRLLSPVLGSAALAGAVPTLTTHTVSWQRAVAGPLPIAMRPCEARIATTPAALAELIRTDAVLPCIVPLVTALQQEFRLSRKVLLGNVASALNGAASVIRTVRPERATTALTIVAELLNHPPLTGTGRYSTGFRRQSCCLLYRVPRAGMCGDCVLRTLR